MGAQSEEYASKLREVGCRPDHATISGNLKFDTAKLGGEKRIDVPLLFANLGVAPNAPVLVAGSTHKGEEKILVQQFLRLRKRFPNLFLVLVPRHFERAQEVIRILKKYGLKFFLRSEFASETRFEPDSVDCLLVNTTGELMNFFEYATVVFVGKSLTAKGGQNPIEPAALGRPTIFGPNMQNFADVARIFVLKKGPFRSVMQRSWSALCSNCSMIRINVRFWAKRLKGLFAQTKGPCSELQT